MKKYLLVIITIIVFSSKDYSQVIFKRVLGTSGMANDIIESADHNFIYVGSDGYLVLASKIDSAGDTIWVKHFGSTSGMNPANWGNSITYINDNRYLITGTSTYDDQVSEASEIYAFMIDSAGNEIWEGAYNWNYEGNEGSNAVYDSADQRIYFVGYEEYPNTYIIKTDMSGNVIWDTIYPIGWNNKGIKIGMRNENDIFIIGNIMMNNNGNYDGMLLEYDSSGTVISMKEYDLNSYDSFNDFRILPDSGFMILGTTSDSGYSEIWLLRLNKNGDTVWTKRYGQDSINISANHFVYNSLSNTYWICGFQGYDNAWKIFETDTSGNVLFEINSIDSNKLLNSIIESSEHSIYAIGSYYSNVYLVRLDSAYIFSGINNTILSEHDNVVVYPNPSNAVLNIQLSTPSSNQLITITNILGEEVYHQNNKSNQTTIDVNTWSKGVYILQIRDEKESIVRKVVIE